MGKEKVDRTAPGVSRMIKRNSRTKKEAEGGVHLECMAAIETRNETTKVDYIGRLHCYVARIQF